MTIYKRLSSDRIGQDQRTKMVTATLSPKLGQKFTAVRCSEPERVQGKELENLVFY